MTATMTKEHKMVIATWTNNLLILVVAGLTTWAVYAGLQFAVRTINPDSFLMLIFAFAALVVWCLIMTYGLALMMKYVSPLWQAWTGE